MILLCAGWITIWIYRSALAPVYPQIRASLGGNVSDTALGAIFSFYSFGYVTMQIPAGTLIDKVGQRKVLIPGFILFGCAILLIAFASKIQTIYLGNFLAGLGCGVFYGSAYSLTSQNIPHAKKSFATAIVNSGSAVGSGLGMLLSSVLVTQLGFPWQTMIFVVIAFILCMLIAFPKVIKEPKKVAEKTTTNKKRKPKMSIKSLFVPKMLTIYLLYFTTCYAYYMIVSWLPNFLATERGFKGAAVGLSSSLVAFASIPGALLFSNLADKYMNHKIKFIVSLELLVAIMLFLTVQATNSTLLLIALILYGLLGKLAVEPIIISWLGEHVPNIGIGTTLGVFNFFGMMSSIVAPTLTGNVSDITGSKIIGFYIAIALLIIGTFLFLLTNMNKSKS